MLCKAKENKNGLLLVMQAKPTKRERKRSFFSWFF